MQFLLVLCGAFAWLFVTPSWSAKVVFKVGLVYIVVRVIAPIWVGVAVEVFAGSANAVVFWVADALMKFT